MVAANPTESETSRLRREYVRIKNIAVGFGGSNRGIYIVRRRSDKQLFVEKRVPLGPTEPDVTEAAATGGHQADDGGGGGGGPTHGAESDRHDAARIRQIAIHRSLRHANIVAYVDSFLAPRATKASARRATASAAGAAAAAGSVIMHLYPLGSLRGLNRRADHECLRLDERLGVWGAAKGVLLPEAFVWHVLLSLTRALTYLATGYRTELANGAVRPAKGWQPLLHRDVNAGNVLLRQPLPSNVGGVSGSGDSDVGGDSGGGDGGGGGGGEGVEEDEKAYPEVALSDFGHAIAAVELAREQERMRRQNKELLEQSPQYAGGQPRPSDPKGRTDVRKVGDTVKELCHYDIPDASGAGAYSQGLRKALALATTGEDENRPTARELLKSLVHLHKEVNPPFVPLPPWAVEQSDNYRLDEEKMEEEKEVDSDDGTSGDDDGDDDVGEDYVEKADKQEDNENEGDNMEIDEGEDGDLKADNEMDDGSWGESEFGENFIKGPKQVEVVKEDKEEEEEMNVYRDDGTTERILRKRRIHSTRKSTTVVKRRRS